MLSLLKDFRTPTAWPEHQHWGKLLARRFTSERGVAGQRLEVYVGPENESRREMFLPLPVIRCKPVAGWRVLFVERAIAAPVV